MFRIREEDGAVHGPHWEFTEGEPGPQGHRPTNVTARFLNDCQNELVNTVEASGQSLSATDQAQLARAITYFSLRGADQVVVGEGGHFASLTEAVASAPARSSILVVSSQIIAAPIPVRKEFISVRFRWGVTVGSSDPDIHHIFSVYGNGFRLQDLHTEGFSHLVSCENPPLDFMFIGNSTLRGGRGAVLGTQPHFLDLSTFVTY